MKRKLLISFFCVCLGLCVFGTFTASAETSYEDYDDLKSAEEEYGIAAKPPYDDEEILEAFEVGADIVMNIEIMSSAVRVLDQLSQFCNIETYMVFSQTKVMTDIEAFALLGGIGIIGALILHGKAATE